MSKREFVRTFGEIYEASPWVAERSWELSDGSPPAKLDALLALMKKVVGEANDDTKMTLVRAHPDLAGRAAMSGSLSAASTKEQSGAGLDNCSAEEYHLFQDLNRAYKKKFGFPFIIAVRGRTRPEILAIFRQRLRNNPADEFQTAIAEIHQIARLRLEALVAKSESQCEDV